MNTPNPYEPKEFLRLFRNDLDHVCLYDATRMKDTVLELERLRSENERLNAEIGIHLDALQKAHKERDEAQKGIGEESARLQKRLLRAEELLRTFVVFGGPPKPRSLAWDVTLDEARVFLEGGR